MTSTPPRKNARAGSRAGATAPAPLPMDPGGITSGGAITVVEWWEYKIREMTCTFEGLIYGESGISGGTMNGVVGDEAASSGAYFAGWMLSGVVAAGDARDTVEALYQANYIGAGMNAAGFIPLVGDSGKTANNARKYIVKYPGKARELGAYVSRQILPYTPNNFAKVEIWDILYDGAGSRLVRGPATTDHVLEVLKRNEKIDLDEVARISPLSTGKAIPLPKEWKLHYEGRHVTGELEKFREGTTLFPTNEPVNWGGKIYPGTSSLSRAQMNDIIPEWIDEGLYAKATEWPTQKTPIKYTFPEERYGIRKIEIALDSTGTYSVYPLEGSQVLKWYNNQWNPRPFTVFE